MRGFRLKFSLFSHISAGAGSGPLGRRNKTLEREGGGGGGGGAVKDTRTAERGVIVCQVAIQGFLEEI